MNDTPTPPPDDQLDLKLCEVPLQEMKLRTRKNTKKQWQYICKIKGGELFV